MNRFILYFLILFSLSSCVIRMPKYASVDQVFALKMNMSKPEVDSVLGITPYALKSMKDSEIVYIYKYRTTDRKIIAMFTKKTNGMKVTGRFMDLAITYDSDDKVREIKSKPSDEEVKVSSNIDINMLFTFLTVTAPAALVYFGLQHK
jgi:hypothetical protein